MAFGSFERKSSSSPMAEINMVPLIDVVLVLLVIFIVTAPLLTNSIKVNLPQTASNVSPEPKRAVNVSVDAQGMITAIAKAEIHAVAEMSSHACSRASHSRLLSGRKMPRSPTRSACAWNWRAT